MEFRTLANILVPDIINAFNEAFSDYFIKLQLNKETMASKIKSEHILLNYSVGAFENEQLVGFILHGYDIMDGIKTIYNAGTGVLPAFRGQGITASLYRYCIPLLKREGISSHILEVIDNNYPAIKIYEQSGFKKIRTLSAFKCSNVIAVHKPFEIQQMEDIDEETRSFFSMTPAWQNSLASIKRDIQGHKILGVFENSQLIAYAAYVPATGRVRQCAVHPFYRRKGIGTALFHYMMQDSTTGELLVTNFDDAYKPGICFLQSLGFKKLLGLYEMKLMVE
jgi:ribosomal protein S18 acetylase RimI-like enzyme